MELSSLPGERWNFAELELNPTADLTHVSKIGMGTVGYATSGGAFFDHRSSPQGNLAWFYELKTLDYSLGHSNPFKQYHYHAVSKLELGLAGIRTILARLGNSRKGLAK